jgi:hypothetical protein
MGKLIDRALSALILFFVLSIESAMWLLGEDLSTPRRGLRESHQWLKAKGLSDWDLERMKLSESHPPAPGSRSLPKMEYRNYLSPQVTFNSGSR